MENKTIDIEPRAAELITKAEANAEGFSVVPNNECMTKAEFVANLPTPPISHMTFHWEIKGAL